MKYILIIFFSLFAFMSCFIAAGSYANAESYIVDIPYEKRVENIRTFKDNNSDYQYLVNKDGEMKNLDQNDEEFIDFYLPKTNQMLSCITLPLDDPNKTRICLVYVSTPITGTGYKKINSSELSKDENERIKKEFETEILDKLGKWDHYVSGFLRFLGFH